MKTDSISKEIQYPGLDEYKKTFLEYFTSIFVLKDCKYSKRKPQYQLPYLLKVNLEMKIPSYKEMKKFCGTDWYKIAMCKNSEPKFECHLINESDTPYINLYSNDKEFIMEMKKTILAKIEENR